ncbi:MAG: hypothetical protein IT440_12205 [Phycisphaeraceae bacterium]|nr:hypothetical protein [Phycisphaeraceae bacterium]
MLKWFRRYNKFILAIGGSLLMVAFLITPMISRATSDNYGKQPIGTLDGRKITLAQQQNAARAMALVRDVHPLLSVLAPDDSLAWMLMQEEARQLGVSASNYEVSEVLSVLGVTDEQLAKLAGKLGVTSTDVRQSLAELIALQNYRDLVTGAQHERLALKLGQIGAVYQQFGSLNNVQGMLRQYYMSMLMQEIGRLQQGQPRISEPMLRRFVADHFSTVRVEMVPVPPQRYMKDMTPPTDEQIKALYDAYKNVLPGTSEPNGFGYLLPDRVKLEYLWLPMDRVRAKATVTEAEAIAYYDQHQDEFRTPVPAATQPATTEPAKTEPGKVRAYEEVRDLILEQMRDSEASKLADRIIKSAHALLLRDARNLAIQATGYREIPADYKPASLEDIAKSIQQQFGVLPDVVSDDQRWLNMQDMAALPNLGMSVVMGKETVRFPSYVHSVQELSPAADDPTTALRLQVGLPSMPLRSMSQLSGNTGGRGLFRVLAAEKSREPHSLDEVKAQVTADAVKVEAYRRALADQDNWRQRLTKDSLAIIAPELGQTITKTQAFSRREIGAMKIEAPQVELVGRDMGFVDGVFLKAEELAKEQPDLEKLSPDKRSDVIGSQRALTLYLVRIDEFKPVNASDYERMLAMPQLAGRVGQTFAGEQPEDPFSVEALARRVGYQSELPLENRKRKAMP